MLIQAEQIATLRSIHREALASADPVAHVTEQLHRVFTDAQRAQIAQDLEGYGRSFEGFASAVAADFLPDDDGEQLVQSIATIFEDAGLDAQMDY